MPWEMKAPPGRSPVTVMDKEAPTLELPELVTLNCGDHVPAPWQTPEQLFTAGGLASDNCELDETSFQLLSETKTSETCPYTITRTYEVSDVKGNSVTAEHRIIVEGEEEQQEPVILKSGMAGLTINAVNDGDWNTPGTWDCNCIPEFDDDVTIPNGVTVTIDGAATCNNITIESGGTLDHSGATTLQVNGSWTNDGTYTAGINGTIEFTGMNAATVSGTTSTVFKHFSITKGDVGKVLQVNGDIELSGDITMTSGLLQINSGANVNCTYNAGFTIENGAGLFVNGGSFTIGDFSIDNKGLLQIDNGTLNIGNSSGNGMVVMSSGTFDINGGTVNIAGRLEVSGGTADISGGTVNLNTVGHNSSTKGTLDLSPSADWNMTGGILNIKKPNGTGNYDILIRNGTGGNKNFSSGTVNIGDGSTATYNITSQIPFPDFNVAGNTNIILEMLVSSDGTYNFPLVDGSGNSLPASITISGDSYASGASIIFETTGSKLSENKSSANYLNRYWTITTNGITNPNYDVTVNYNISDIAGTESAIAAGLWTGSLPWQKDGAASSNSITFRGITATSAEITGITLAPPTISIDEGATATICLGDIFDIHTTADGDPVLTYSWTSTPAGYTETSADINVSPTENTIYIVEVTDGNGFTSNATIDVSVNPIPTVDVITNQDLCDGEAISPINFTGTGTSYPWTNDNTSTGLAAGGTGDIASFTATNTGNTIQTSTITVTPVYSNNGTDCTGVPESFTITVNPKPTVSATPATQQVCPGGSITQIDITNPNAVSGTTYSWTRDNTSTLTGIATSGTGSTITGTFNTANPGVMETATFTITATANGCSSQTTVEVVVGDDAAPTAICQNITVQLDASGNVTIAEDAVK